MRQTIKSSKPWHSSSPPATCQTKLHYCFKVSFEHHFLYVSWRSRGAARRGAVEEDRPLSHFACSLLSSSLIFFLISPNIIVIWPDDDDVCSQIFSCRVVTTSHYPVKSFLKSERVIFIQAGCRDSRDQVTHTSRTLNKIGASSHPLRDNRECQCTSIPVDCRKSIFANFSISDTLSLETLCRFTGLAPAFRNGSAPSL